MSHGSGGNNTHAHAHTRAHSPVLSHSVYCTFLSEVLGLLQSQKTKALNIISMSPELKKDYPKYLIGEFILRKPWCLQHTRPHCICVNSKLCRCASGFDLTAHFNNLHSVVFVTELALQNHQYARVISEICDNQYNQYLTSLHYYA